MERDSLLRIYYKNEVKTLREKAEFIYDRHLKVSNILDNKYWVLDGKGVDINNKEEIYSILLKSFKKLIKRHTTITKIEDDYIDEFSSFEVFNQSKKYLECCKITYNIETKDLGKNASNLVMKKYEKLSVMQNYETAKQFIYNLVDIFNPFSIEVTETETLYDLDELSGKKFWPGWMLYFDSSYKLPQLPEWVKIETLANGGHLIITTEEVFNPANPEHKEKARSLLPLLQLKKPRRCWFS